jgi:hypothetical protein
MADRREAAPSLGLRFWLESPSRHSRFVGKQGTARNKVKVGKVG